MTHRIQTQSTSSLPVHGRVSCTRCFSGCGPVEFDSTQRGDGDWRITNNPLSWGNAQPEVVVLGFSKGPTQAGALGRSAHDEIAYKGSRGNVAKILAHVGLLQCESQEDPKAAVDALIADRQGRFHFGSLVRCTVERREKDIWKGSGGGMLDKFNATLFGRDVAANCTKQFLGGLPSSTRLIVMFGMGSKGNYVRASFDLYQRARPGPWRWINDVAYTDGAITVVHVEHFASQGPLIPQWLGERDHPRQRLGAMAQSAIRVALATRMADSWFALGSYSAGHQPTGLSENTMHSKGSL